MIRRTFFFLASLLALVACSDDDTFTTSTSARLTFSTDSVKMDTIFSTIGSRTYDFWVYNQSNDGIRLQSVRLKQGNQTGFRVNVDGTYLDNTLGSVAGDLEVRKDDSIRVFVELTTPENGQPEPKLIQDLLVFRLESGVEQSIVLQGYSWDAVFMRDVVVSRDSVIESDKPVVIYGGLKVEQGATLTIRHTTLYFHDGPGIEVFGRLLTDSVTLRGDRLDHMFDYLPYDRVSGQWGKDYGIAFRETSTGNVLRNTEIRNAGAYGVVCDSAAYDAGMLRLDMQQCVVHNCTGVGFASINSHVRLTDCLISNTLGGCVAVNGGQVDMKRCTLAQFYPFSAMRGASLTFLNESPLYGLTCDSVIVTGYDADEVMGIQSDTTQVFEYQFLNTLLRTPRVETADSVHFSKVIWETPKDSVQGKQHFRLVDETNLIYDFRLDSISPAQGLGWQGREIR